MFSNSKIIFWTTFSLISLVLLRVFVLGVSPLGLGGDEAQYWQWSTIPAWGYFSKPPMIAWGIAATTNLFGDSVFAVRFASPILHGLAGLLLWATSRQLWPKQPTTAIWASVIYLVMPGVFLSSFLMSTDAFLLPGAALVIFTWSKARAEGAHFGWVIAFGLALSFGMLAKYATLFLLAGFMVTIFLDPPTRLLLVSRKGLVVFAIIAALLLPNLAWNQAHSFATLSHTAANMDVDASFNWAALASKLKQVFSFWLSQFGIFGPIPLILLGFAGVAAAFGKLDRSARNLLVLSLLPLLIISVQAFLSRANANWAVIAYVPASLLLARFIVSHRHQKILIAGLALQMIVGFGFMSVLVKPNLLHNTQIADVTDPLLGWSETTNQILKTFNEPDRAYSAILTDTRLFHYAVTWELRDQPQTKIRMWSRYGAPHSHRELMQPIADNDGQNYLVAISRPRFLERVKADFRQISFITSVTIELGGGRTRKFDLYAASEFFPQTRNAAYEQKWRHLDEEPGN